MPRGKKTATTPKGKGRAPKAARRPGGAQPAEVLKGEVVDAPAVVEAAPEPPREPEPGPGEVEPSDAEVEELEVEPASRAKAPALVRARSEPGLVSRDPLQAYMAEVGRHPLLSREEEHSLAVHYRDTGDVKAAYRLVAANLRLVVKLAHEYHRNPMSLLDLVQEGNMGLMQAVKKYDPDRGVKLSSYAAWWIRAYILRYIMDNWKMVKLGTTEAQRKLFFKLRQEQDRLMVQGLEVTPKLLAERLNVTEQDVVEMDQRLGHDELSLDAPLGDDSRHTRADRFMPPAATAAADETLANEQLKRLFREKLTEFARTLKDKERYIYERRLIAENPLTLQDIGDHFGFSRERARQIEAGLMGRIRDYMRTEMPDFDLHLPK